MPAVSLSRTANGEPVDCEPANCELLTYFFSCTTNTSWRAFVAGSLMGSVPSVFSQLDVKRTQRPSGETLGRGEYQKDVAVGSTSLWTSLRWWAKRPPVASAPAAVSVCTATISSSHARHAVVDAGDRIRPLMNGMS